MITPQDKHDAEQFCAVHPVFQPLLKHYQEQARFRALRCATERDQTEVNRLSVEFACEQQARAIREARDWLALGQPGRAAEALGRALP